jgi:hypothetical protein
MIENLLERPGIESYTQKVSSGSARTMNELKNQGNRMNLETAVEPFLRELCRVCETLKSSAL